MTTLLMLLLASAPLFLLAYFLHAYPHRPLVYLALLPALMSVSLIVVGEDSVPAVVIPFLGHDYCGATFPTSSQTT